MWKKVKAHSAKDNICSWPSTIARMTKENNQLLTASASASTASTTDEQRSLHTDDKAKADEAKSDSSTSLLPPLYRIQIDESDSFYMVVISYFDQIWTSALEI